jgi:clan AA aspartic protease (TIGR02281 family)
MIRSKLFVFLFLFSPPLFSQTVTREQWVKMETEGMIRKGEYDEAIKYLEPYAGMLKTDTSWSELLDCLGELYLLQNEWQKTYDLYHDHIFQKEEDSTLLALSRVYRSAPRLNIPAFPSQNIAFQPSISGTPVIEVKVNGKVFHFWVDTGAGMSVLTTSTAKKCGVKILGNGGNAMAATGITIPTSYAMIDSLRIGQMQVQHLPCLILQNKQLEFRLLGIRIVKIDGIIGWNLLQELSVTFRQDTHQIVFAMPGEKKNGRQDVFWMGVPLFTCTDSTGTPLLFTFDSGANISAVYPQYFPKGDTLHAKEKKVTLGSAGGKRTIRSLTFPRIVLNAGGQKIVLKKTGTDPALSQGLLSPDGVLGINVLSKYNFHFDLRGGVFELK